MSRTYFASKNYLYSAIYTAITLVVGFAATPWLLKWLGVEVFGAVRVISDWTGYLGIFELGLGGALLPLLASALGKNEQNRIRDLLAASVRIYLGVAGAMLAAGVLLATIITRLIAVSPQHVWDLRIGCLLGVSSVLWIPLVSPFRALFDAQQRSYWISRLLVGQSLLITTCSLLMAWLRWGITGQFVALIVGGLVLNVVLIWQGLRRYPGVFVQAIQGRFDRQSARDIWKLNMPTYIVNLCGRISLLTDNIVVAAILGPIMVVPLILTQRLALLVQGQLQGIGNASWAGLAELHARGEHDLFRTRLVELTAITCTLASAVLFPIAVFNRSFVSLWVGSVHYGGQWMTLFAVVNAFLLSVISLWGWAFTGTGEVRRVVRPLIFQAILNFLGSVILTKYIGPVGPLIGTFIGFIAVTLWVFPFQLQQAFGVAFSKLIGAVAKPAMLGLPYAVVLWLCERLHAPRGWFALCGEMLLAVLLYLASAWGLILTLSEREVWYCRIRLLLRFSAANESQATLQHAPNSFESTGLSQ